MTWSLRAVSGLGPESRRPQSGALRSAFPAGSRGIPGPCWLAPFAVEPSHLANSGGNGQRRMIAPLAGVVVAACACFGRSAGLQTVESAQMLNGPLYGSLPATQAWIRNSRFARSCRQRWPDPAHLRGKRGDPPTCPAQAVDQRGSAKAMRYWPTGGDRRRRCRCGLSASFLSSFAHLPSPSPCLQPHHRDGLDLNEVRTIILRAQRQDRL